MIRYLSPIDFVTGVLSTYDSGDLQSEGLRFFGITENNASMLAGYVILRYG